MRKTVNNIGLVMLFFTTINIIMGITSIKNKYIYENVGVERPVYNDTIIKQLKDDIKKCEDLDQRIDSLNKR